MVTTEAGVPEPILAVMESLQFQQPSTQRLRSVASEDWDGLLDWCDRRQITFVLLSACGAELPDRVRDRMTASLQRYSLRFARLQQQQLGIIDLLNRSRIPFALLKGVTHSPALTPDPLLRAQGDIDLWMPRTAIQPARQILAWEGYVTGGGAPSGRHLQPLVQPTNWHWRGDIFDPEMPVRVELHHDLWRSPEEHIFIPGEDRFYERLESRDFGGSCAQVLCPPDLIGFAALHLLLHLLHGDLPLQRAWEIARFLHERAEDAPFWSLWREYHPHELRMAEAVVFQIVAAWFGCRTSAVVQEDARAIPDEVRLWIEHFAHSPLAQQHRPNKDEIWLHLALIPSFSGRMRILLRRLFPVNASWKRTVSTSRLRRHITILLPTLAQGLRWRRLRRANDR